MTRNRVIGVDGHLPWALPDEMDHFRSTTLDRPIIMGRRTFDAMQRKPLPKRQNIVMSRSEISIEGVHHAANLTKALSIARDSGATECFVIGGSYIYAEALPVANRLYETIIDAEIKGDVYFPEYNAEEWREIQRSHHGIDELHPYAFDITLLERKS